MKDNSKETFGIGTQRLLKRNNSEPFINNKINNNLQTFSNDIKPVLKRNKSALFRKDKKIFKRYNFRTPDGTVDLMESDLKINTNTPYVLFQYWNGSVVEITDGYDFIASYDNNGKLIIYELVGIQLGNKLHGVCFAKKGNTNNSWCGIDSNRNANDNNYQLEDIKYKAELGNNNTYLAKVYANKTECNNNVLDSKKNKKDGPYLAQLLLYKKLSQEEL